MCDTVVVVDRDCVLFAKNSDRDPNEPQVLDWQPARDHAPGARLACTWMAIPQARRTHAVLLSRPFWMWGAEIGANEHGVVIGNEAVFTRTPVAATGLTGMDLLRLGLERGASAAEAVAVMTSLLEEHGQGGGCGHEDRGFRYHSSFLVADAGGAVVLETSGRRWMKQAVAPGEARAISNRLALAGFAQEHGRELEGRVCQAAGRQARLERAARHAATPLTLMRALRDHGAEPTYRWWNGAMGATCMHAGGLLAASQTTASWVAELRPGQARHWATATAAPCTSLFKPVEVGTPLPTPLASDRYDEAVAWWRHERLHRLALRDPARLLPLFAPERDALEARWLEQRPAPAAAFAEAEALEARWTAAVTHAAGPDGRPWVARQYWRRRDRRAGLPV